MEEGERQEGRKAGRHIVSWCEGYRKDVIKQVDDVLPSFRHGIFECLSAWVYPCIFVYLSKLVITAIAISKRSRRVDIGPFLCVCVVGVDGSSKASKH